jgi:hypothetical protein
MEAIDVFLDAINEGSLAKGSCVACAVGNLVAHGLGGKVTIDNGLASFEHPWSGFLDNSRWSDAFCTYNTGRQKVDRGALRRFTVIRNIEATDFTAEELMQIEYAFEMNTKIHFMSYYRYTPQQIREDQINGLAAVVKVMLSFEDKELATDALVQELFIDKANLIKIK